MIKIYNIQRLFDANTIYESGSYDSLYRSGLLSYAYFSPTLRSLKLGTYVGYADEVDEYTVHRILEDESL
jgi:hypothetical protein